MRDSGGQCWKNRASTATAQGDKTVAFSIFIPDPPCDYVPLYHSPHNSVLFIFQEHFNLTEFLVNYSIEITFTQHITGTLHISL